ncbi:MAG: hypothetical protein HOU81_04230 [Hamadaea sp.]|uniref:hypothetical protein n=1 Tax=Hamadaea sp. NPDC050747 TaxID=3155789 RepID=UPI0017E7695B|nr:hypothetical protein [Hamadaea sp.]
MRAALAGAVTAALLLSGCTASPPTPKPAPTVQQRPAAAEGGACQLIDFAKVSGSLGRSFTIAAAATKDKTFTCVVRTEQSPLPEVVLSVTQTKADASVFKDVVKPKGATDVPGVGKAAYQLVTPAKGQVGPVVEIGWLTGDARLLFLRLSLAADADPAAAAPGLVKLAKEIDKSSN